MIGSTKSLREHYPHVDPQFAEVLLMALRMRDVAGSRIGEILAEVEEHCAASGESAPAAFGDPKEYAASLDFEGQRRAATPVRARDLVMGATQLLGAALTTWGLTGALGAEVVDVRWGALAAALLTVVALLVAVRYLDSLLAGTPWRWIGLNVAVIAALVGVLLWGGPVAFSSPAMPLAVAGAILLLGPAIYGTARYDDTADDTIRPPGQQATRRELRTARLLTVAAYWMLPVLIPAMVLIPWLFRR